MRRALWIAPSTRSSIGTGAGTSSAPDSKRARVTMLAAGRPTLARPAGGRPRDLARPPSTWGASYDVAKLLAALAYALAGLAALGLLVTGLGREKGRMALVSSMCSPKPFTLLLALLSATCSPVRSPTEPSQRSREWATRIAEMRAASGRGGFDLRASAQRLRDLEARARPRGRSRRRGCNTRASCASSAASLATFKRSRISRSSSKRLGRSCCWRATRDRARRTQRRSLARCGRGSRGSAL
jgi:hypothetical protein